MTGFKDYPETVGEIRADKTQSAADWSPRDVLINVLRDIDNGKLSPTTLIVCHDDNSGMPHYASCAEKLSDTLGLIERIKFMLLSR